ncbi:MAG: hypothetical protein ABSC10_17140 [Candidatus Acidiferrales bacterium]|jgi:aerobic-type carbon monoxide dehydrogenase small subunit (CoxS/CutS family)
MDAISLTVNGRQHFVEVSPDAPSLWLLTTARLRASAGGAQ